MRSRIGLAGLLILAVASPVGATSTQAPLKPAVIDVKLGVLSNGTILLAGRKSTVARVKARLATAQRQGGTVWYYRQNPFGMPSQRATASMEAVMTMVVHDGLPVTLSTKPDYSDVIEEDGRVHPRTAS